MSENIFIFIFFPFFIGMWVGISFLLAQIGGWANLGAIYRTEKLLPNQVFNFVSGWTRWGVSYRSCLTVGADTDGIYCKPLFLFRAFHPPLFIPWSDISFKENQVWFMQAVRFDIAKTPGIHISLWRKTGIKLLEVMP